MPETTVCIMDGGIVDGGEVPVPDNMTLLFFKFGDHIHVYLRAGPDRFQFDQVKSATDSEFLAVLTAFGIHIRGNPDE